MGRIYDWLNDQVRNPKIFGSRLNDEFDNVFNTIVEASGTVTLTANATTTTVTAARCTTSSKVFLSPQTAHAANDMATTSIASGTGQFVITHANNTRVDRTFGYLVTA